MHIVCSSGVIVVSSNVSGFVSQTSPTSDCEACSSYCTYCMNDADTNCWNSDSRSYFKFAVAAKDHHSLPYIAQTHNMRCYRMKIADTPTCFIPAVMILVGLIGLKDRMQSL